MTEERSLSRCWWFTVPLVFLGIYAAGLAAMELGWTGRLDTLLHSEFGLLETAQNLTLAAVIVLAAALGRSKGIGRAASRFFWILFAGGIFILGEEISWGQHYFGWATPQWWAEANYQEETNLHNINSSWFIFKPRIFLEFVIYGAGIVWPLIRHWRRPNLSPRARWLSPTHAVVLTGLIVLVLGLPHRIEKAFEADLAWLLSSPFDFQEVRECAIYYFMFLYLFSAKRRLPMASGAPNTAHAISPAQ